MVGLFVVIEGIRQLFDKDAVQHTESLMIMVFAMLTVIGTKAALYMFCRKSPNQAVQAYAEDHRNDVSLASILDLSHLCLLLSVSFKTPLDPRFLIQLIQSRS